MQIIINVESELDAHGIEASVSASTEAIETWLRREIAEHIKDMLEAGGVAFKESEA